MISQAKISFGGVEIERQVVVVGGFTDDLILEHRDIVDLGLGDPIRSAAFHLAGGTPADYNF